MEITLLKGDITLQQVDIIVNAANTSLLGGGGVDGAIHRAGGSNILEECIKIRNREGGCAVGEAVITSAGKLPSKYVIHTVGPAWNGGNSNEKNKLAQCYENSLLLAEEKQATSICFPNISTGIYRFPKHAAATIAIGVVKKNQSKSLEEVRFVCFDEENHRIYKELLQR